MDKVEIVQISSKELGSGDINATQKTVLQYFYFSGKFAYSICSLWPVIWYPLKCTIIHLVLNWVRCVITISSAYQRAFGLFFYGSLLLLPGEIFNEHFQKNRN